MIGGMTHNGVIEGWEWLMLLPAAVVVFWWGRRR